MFRPEKLPCGKAASASFIILISITPKNGKNGYLCLTVAGKNAHSIEHGFGQSSMIYKWLVVHMSPDSYLFHPFLFLSPPMRARLFRVSIRGLDCPAIPIAAVSGALRTMT